MIGTLSLHIDRHFSMIFNEKEGLKRLSLLLEKLLFITGEI